MRRADSSVKGCTNPVRSLQGQKNGEDINTQIKSKKVEACGVSRLVGRMCVLEDAGQAEVKVARRPPR